MTTTAGGGGMVSLAEFQRLALRVGIITAAAVHPNADRLLVLQVNVGGEPPQHLQVVAGIKQAYDAESLVGKAVVVVTNLEPATIRGVESQGMVLAASDGSQLAVVVPDRLMPAGSLVK